MSEFDVLAVIAVASLLLGLIVGVVMYRADFCVTIMFRELFLLRDGYVTGYLQPFHAAMPLGVIGFSSYLVIGMPWGITTLYTKLGSSIEALIVPEHINQLKYLNATLPSYNPPFALQSISGGAGPAWDGIAAIQYPLIAGIILGALLYSHTIREFAWHYRAPFRDYVSAAAGGLLLGWQHAWYPDVISGTCEKAC